MKADGEIKKENQTNQNHKQMSIISQQMFESHMSAIAAAYDAEFPTPSEHDKGIFLHGNDDKWNLKGFDRSQGIVYLHCKRTDEEGFMRWEAIRYIEPF
jgi:hypothetical protein